MPTQAAPSRTAVMAASTATLPPPKTSTRLPFMEDCVLGTEVRPLFSVYSQVDFTQELCRQHDLWKVIARDGQLDASMGADRDKTASYL